MTSRPLLRTLSSTGATARVRTFTLALFLALFVLVLASRDDAHADEAVDSTSTTATVSSDEATVDPPVEAEDPTPTTTPTTVPSDEGAAAEPVEVPEVDATEPTPDVVVIDETDAVVVEEADVVVVDEAVDATDEVTDVLAPEATVPAPALPLARQLVETADVTAEADIAPAITQCNADTFPTGAGWEASCAVTVENTVGNDGSTSSRVTTTWCLAEAGVLPPEGCTTNVTTSDQLVTSVDQCNGILAGGSNVTCFVEVINNVPFGTPTTAVTVNQCIGSGQGGVSPDGPPTDCDPVDSSTSGATVTQCNGSANGGGGPERVQCSVSGSESATPVTVNQCNGSTAAGSTVTCGVSFTNNFAAAVDDTDGAPTPTPIVTTTTPTPDDDFGRTVAFTPAASSRSSLRSTPAGTATSLAMTGPGFGTSLLLALAMLFLLLGSAFLTLSNRPATTA